MIYDGSWRHEPWEKQSVKPEICVINPKEKSTNEEIYNYILRIIALRTHSTHFVGNTGGAFATKPHDHDYG